MSRRHRAERREVLPDAKYGDRVRDAPINEPMIVGTAVGAALHRELTLLPEVQFGDDTLNFPVTAGVTYYVVVEAVLWGLFGNMDYNLTVTFP